MSKVSELNLLSKANVAGLSWLQTGKLKTDLLHQIKRDQTPHIG